MGDDVQKIALFPHKTPDGDTIGSCVAFKRIIELVTGKKVDIFVAEELSEKMKLIDTNNDIKEIKNILNPDYTQEQFFEKFGKYDMSIGIDNADIVQFPDKFFDIFKTSKYTAKIDHHPAEKGDKRRNYAKINLVDTTKDAATQLIMEFVHAFGIKDGDITNFISDPLFKGLYTDTQQFKYVSNPSTFTDAALLRKTSNFEDIMKAFEKIKPEDFDASIKLLGQRQSADNGKISYFFIDNTGEKKITDEAAKEALYKLPNIKGVEYYFFVKQCRGFVTSSIRSNTKPLDKLDEIGARGRGNTRGLKIENKSAEEVADLIITKLAGNE